jgi:hypothetical protein
MRKPKIKVESPESAAGQTWETCDPKIQPPRRVRLDEVTADYAHGRYTDTGRKTRIRKRDLRPTAQGWRLVPTFTVRAQGAAETILADHVDMSRALDAHETHQGRATIYDDSDGEPACMAEYGNMGACECHRCAAKEQ